MGSMKLETNIKTPRCFKVIHQLLCITGINFDEKSIEGLTELAIVCIQPDVTEIKLNCKQCEIVRVYFGDGSEADFQHIDQLKQMELGDHGRRDLNYFSDLHTEAVKAGDPELASGELTVYIPASFQSHVQDQKLLRVGLEFRLVKPVAGLRFACHGTSDSLRERAAHLFTIKHENNSRLWFPCVDAWSEPCTWKIEITAEAELTAVASGDLLDTYYVADMRSRTFHYYMAVPTPACNIGLAVGPFDIVVPPDLPEVTHFCLPNLEDMLKQSISTFDKTYEFFEELLSVRFPYPCYKQVFVEQPDTEISAYATMTILSTSLLHYRRIIDQVTVSRTIMAHAVAQQFFGCFVPPYSWQDCWLTKGISSYITGLFVQRYFGNNEYLYQIYKMCGEVAQFEEAWGPISLRPKSLASTSGPTAYEEQNHCCSRSAHTCSPLYASMLSKKAHVILRLTEKKLGREMTSQVFNQLISVATNASQQKFAPVAWMNMLLSTHSFVRCVSSVTGQDLNEFVEQWVESGGHAKFEISFSFNRKRNLIELEVRQNPSLLGTLKYVGPANVTVQELDGSFSHTIQIDDICSKHEISCHSKARRQKKRKIPLWTGEEVDMDLAMLDPDSPVLWLRFDPEMKILCSVYLHQPDYQWQYQLKHERDVIAQLQALERLAEFPSPQTRQIIGSIIESHFCFFRVRCNACYALAEISNKIAHTLTGVPALMAIFQRMFGSNSCPRIVKANDFRDFQSYFIQCTMPKAMSLLRNASGHCPVEVQQCLLDLFHYNYNKDNKYSDDCYRANLIAALASSITPALSTGYAQSYSLGRESNYDIHKTVEEVVLQLNLDKIMPSYKHLVTVNCLRAFSQLSTFGYMKPDPSFFLAYIGPEYFWDVRVAAIDCVAEHVKCHQDFDVLVILLDRIETEEDPLFTYNIVLSLVRNPPFTFGVHSDQSLNVSTVAETLWSFISTKFCHDSKLRCLITDLYYMLYGREQPVCFLRRYSQDSETGPTSDTEMREEEAEAAEPADATREGAESDVEIIMETGPPHQEDSQLSAPSAITAQRRSRNSPGFLSCSSSSDDDDASPTAGKKKSKEESY